MFKTIINYLAGKKENQNEYELSETFLAVQESCKKNDESIKRIDERNREISKLSEEIRVINKRKQELNNQMIDQIKSMRLAGEE